MSRLVRIQAPNAQQAADGAWIVFVREEGGVESFICASYYEGSYQQWGATLPMLGDNVGAVSAWADGMREVESFVSDDDDDDEDEDEDPDFEGGVPVFEECGVCGHYHRPTYGGDCRNDEERFTADQLDERYGAHGWVARDLDDQEPSGRVAVFSGGVMLGGPGRGFFWAPYDRDDAALFGASDTLPVFGPFDTVDAAKGGALESYRDAGAGAPSFAHEDDALPDWLPPGF